MTSRLLLAAVLVAFGAPSVNAEAEPTESKQEKRAREKAERAEKRRERAKRAKEKRAKLRRQRREADRQAAKDAAAAAKAGEQALAAKAAEQAAGERAAAEQATAAKIADQTAKKPTTSRDAPATDPAANSEADSSTPQTESPSNLLSTELPSAEPAPPPPTPPPAPAATITKAAPPPAPRVRTPTWYLALRGGPALVDRRGYNEYRSNRQIYDDERNLRGELAIGRFVSRRLAVGLAASGGPFPKFDAPDPLLDVNTRYSVTAAQARLDLELHAGWFVFALGAGGAYEHAKGTFGYLDPVTMVASAHESAFKRFGAVGAAHLGVQMQLGRVGIELLAGASAIKLFRGTYEHDMSSPGPSDRELAYVGSLLLGLRLQ